MPRYCRPLLMPEVAELLWPGEYTDRPRIGAQRAMRFLRRIERDRDVQLLFRENKRLHTTTGALRQHCRQLLDDPDRIKREIDERWKVALLRLVKVEKTLEKTVKTYNVELFETVRAIRKIRKDVKALSKR
jgi:hypothetical protein